MLTQNALNYECNFCLRKYKIKKNLTMHKVSCEFINKMKNHNHDEFFDSIETIPSQRELYSLIKILALKCDVLENEVKLMKNTVQIRQKKQIIELLNQKNNENISDFIEWYKSYSINDEDLKIVLDYDLTRGIEDILKKMVEITKHNSPICSFKDKSNQIYICRRGGVADGAETLNSGNEVGRVYKFDFNSIEGEPEPEPDSVPLKKIWRRSGIADNSEAINSGNEVGRVWKIANNEEIEKMVNYFSNQLLKYFVKWQKEKISFFTANEKNKDLEIVYMSKITGNKTTNEKRTSEIKKWIICSGLFLFHNE